MLIDELERSKCRSGRIVGGNDEEKEKRNEKEKERRNEKEKEKESDDGAINYDMGINFTV